MKQKEQFNKRAKASKIVVGDRVLIKIVAFDWKHKISDKFKVDVYTVVEQPTPDIPVFIVKSDSGKELTLHWDQLLPLGEKEKTAEKKGKNTQHESVQEKEHEVVKQDSLNGNKDASSGLDNAQAESSVVKLLKRMKKAVTLSSQIMKSYMIM